MSIDCFFKQNLNFLALHWKDSPLKRSTPNTKIKIGEGHFYRLISLPPCFQKKIKNFWRKHSLMIGKLRGGIWFRVIVDSSFNFSYSIEVVTVKTWTYFIVSYIQSTPKIINMSINLMMNMRLGNYRTIITIETQTVFRYYKYVIVFQRNTIAFKGF